MQMEIVPQADGSEPHIVDGKEDEGGLSIPGFPSLSVTLGALLGCILAYSYNRVRLGTPVRASST
jgi:hypothetical protein